MAKRRYTTLADRACTWAEWGPIIRRKQKERGRSGRLKGAQLIAEELQEMGADLTQMQVTKMIREADQGFYDDLPPPDEGTEDPARRSSVKVERKSTAEGESVFIKSSTVRTLRGLLEAAQVDLDRWDVADWRSNKWDQASRNTRTGRVEVVELWQVKANLVPSRASLLEQAPPVPWATIPKATAGLPGATDETWVIVPDSQHGFAWNENHTELAPMHDPAAFDAVRQLCALLQPDGIGLLGDMLDNTEMGKYRIEWQHRHTLLPSVWTLTWDLVELRAACPRSRILYTLGNHEIRTDHRIADRIPGLERLRAHGQEFPALSPRSLFRLDELEIETCDYMRSFWLWDEVEITHGDDIKRPKQVVGGRPYSLLKGHIHTATLEHKRIWGPQGPEVVFVGSPGCLLRLDVPETCPGYNKKPAWDQAVIVLHRVEGITHAHLVPIHNGRLVWGGHVIEGRDRSEEIAAFTGFPQIAAWRRP